MTNPLPGNPISGLPVVVLADGSEIVPVVQGGTTKRMTINQIGAIFGAAAAAVTYYVSPTGLDSNNGLSEDSPWQTIPKVNNTLLSPGTAVLFEGDQTFSGALAPSILGATVAQPIVFGSYGGGKATISSSTSNGFTLALMGGIAVDSLIFTGSASTNRGVFISTTGATSNAHFQGIQVRNCEVSGYGLDGIAVFGGFNGGSGLGSDGFDDVLIDGCVVTGCTSHAAPFTAGISMQGGYGLALIDPSFTNVVIQNCRSDDNAGASTTNWTGTGIFLGNCDGGLIYNCTADGNGAASFSSAGNGTVGIWTGDARNIVIDGCTATNTQTLSGDGGGFDLDGGCTDCTIRNCYSSGNDGAGYLVFSYLDGFVTGNDNLKILNCVSVDDGLGSLNGSGIYLANNGSQTNVTVSGCTVKSSALGTGGAILVAGAQTGAVYDNTFIVSGTQIFVGCATNPAIQFYGNRYISAGAASVLWGGVTYASVAAWATATGQEASGTLNLSKLNSPSFSSATAGLVPASGGGTATFLRADGGFFSPTAVAAAGGANLQLQYNLTGALSGVAGSIWDGASLKLDSTLGVGIAAGSNPITSNQNLLEIGISGDASGANFAVTSFPDSGNHLSATVINYNSTFYGEGLSIAYAHGTAGTPLPLISGDVIGFLAFNGYDGAAFLNPAWIQGRVDGAVSTGVMPMALDFITGSVPATATARLSISSIGSALLTGNLGIVGNSVLTGALGVSGTITGAGSVNATTVNATTGNFSSVLSTVAAFSTLNATTASFSTVVGFTANFTTLGATTANFSTLNAAALNATTGNFTTLNASTLNISSVANITAILNVVGTANVTGRFNLVGTSTITGAIAAVGTAAFSGGTFGVLATTNITGIVSVVGTANFSGGTFGVVATSVFTGIFGSVGTATFTGAYGIIGTTLVTGLFTNVGTAQFTGGSFGVNATSNFTGITNIVGTANLTGLLNVVGTAAFSGGTFGVTATSNFTGIFGLVGTSTLTGTHGVIGTTLVTGLFTNVGTAQFTGGTFGVNATSNITGILGLVGTANITGSFNVVGTTLFTATFFGVVGTSTLTGSHNVIGTSNFSGGNFNVNGTTQFTSTLFNVVGTALFTGTFGVVGTTLVTGIFNNVGTANFSGGAFNVTSIINLVGTATITGVFGQVGTSLMTGLFGVVGSSIFTGTLTVSGTTVLTAIGTGVVIANAGLLTTAGGMVLLATLSPSAVASSNNTSVFTSAYRSYWFVLNNLCPATNTAILQMTVCTTGSAFTTASYVGMANINMSSLAVTDFTTTGFLLSGTRATTAVGTSTVSGVSGVVNFYNPSSAVTNKSLTGQLTYVIASSTISTATLALVAANGIYSSASPVTGVNFVFSTGNIATGTIEIYGIT